MIKVGCPYCGGQAELVDTIEIYKTKSYGMAWLCRPCYAYTGCHAGSPVHKPLGTLANAPLRKLRQEAHAVFDPLWKSKRMRRSAAYALLAEKMEIKTSRCHISMMDDDQCERVIKIFKSK